MQQLTLSRLSADFSSTHPIEIVERKGIGHPDTMCDALAEELSRSLCEYYLEHFGLVLHHNVDKALLWGGTSQPVFNGGKILAPMEIFLAGRATCELKGITVPLDDLVNHSCNNWLRANFHALNPEHHVRIHHLIRPGSADLVELYLRQEKTGIALANDTSCGVGYAPLSELETLVLHIEQHLNSSEIKSTHPEFGEDIKVMGVRRENHFEFTIACAFVDKFISSTKDYVEKKVHLVKLVKHTLRQLTDKSTNIIVNAADNINSESLYLTVTGTSAESGDDGEVGRGNRVNGLITPYRPMNMEAAAGKNPVTHVGKIYNIVAQQIADSIVYEIDDVSEAYCYLLSQIGSPIHDPKIIDLKLNLLEGSSLECVQARTEEIVADKLSSTQKIRQDLLTGKITVY